MRRQKPKEESAIGVPDGAMSRRSPGAGETAGPQAGAAPGPVHDFALALERHGRGTAVLVLGGELDLYRAPEIEDALARAIGPLPGSDRCEPTFDGRSGDGPQIPGEEVRRLAVDLRSVTFIDSTTLALLLAASRHQHAQGGELLVLVGPQTPMSAFEVTGLDRLLAIRRVEDDQGTARHEHERPELAGTGGRGGRDASSSPGRPRSQLHEALRDRMISKAFRTRGGGPK